MVVDTSRFWGLILLSSTFALPIHGPKAPEIHLSQVTDSLSEDAIVCLDCNPLILGKPLNINTAPKDHLVGLPFVGEKRASDIVQYRTEHGPFETVNQLDDVRGIGPKTLQKLLPYIVIE